MNNLTVINHNGQPVVESREVSEMVDKDHSHLLRDIKGYKEVIDHNPNLDSANFFIESTYTNENNQSYPCYLLTRKGCDMVANKMTGEKGVLFTATYVTKFEEMEKQLQVSRLAPVDEVNSLLEMMNPLLDEAEATVNQRMIIYSGILKRVGINLPCIVSESNIDSHAEHLRQFINEECVYERSATITISDFYDFFASWCFNKAIPVPTKTLVGRKAKIIGLKQKRGSKHRYWTGIKVKK